jgi:hypothetical protein
MMTMKQRIGSLLPLLAFALTAGAASVPPPEKLLPADTLGVFVIPDYAKSRSAWTQWPSSQLWADPAMKAFREKFTTKLKTDVIEPLEKELGIKLADYSGLAQGQVAVAFTPGGPNLSAAENPGLLFVLDARDKSEALRTNLANLKTKWVDRGKQIRTEKIRDVEFTALMINTDDIGKTFDKIFPDPTEGNETPEPAKAKKPGKKIELLVGQSGSLLVAGTVLKDIERVLVSQSGGAVPALAEQGGFSSSYNAQLRDAQVYAWLNLKPILDAAAKADAKGGAEGRPNRQPQLGMGLEKAISALGFGGLQTLAVSLRDTPDGCIMNLNVNVPESARRGLIQALSFDAKDASPPPFVPADSVKFTRWRLDLQRAVDTIERTLKEAVPQLAGMVSFMLDNAGKDKDPDFDLRKSLFGNLGDDIISYQKAPRGQTFAELGSPPTLTLIGSPKPDQLASALKTLAGFLPQQPSKIKEREFLGRKIYSVSLPGSPGPGGGKPVERTISFTGSGGYLAVSTDAAMLEGYLRSSEGTAKALRDLPGLAEAAQKVGGMNTGFFSYENQAETMRATVETLKKESGALANLFSGSPLAGRFGMNDDSSKFKEWVDFSLLPSYDKIAKYFYFTVSSGGVVSEGVALKIFSPNPPGFKK